MINSKANCAADKNINAVVSKVAFKGRNGFKGSAGEVCVSVWEWTEHKECER